MKQGFLVLNNLVKVFDTGEKVVTAVDHIDLRFWVPQVAVKQRP